MPKRLQHDDATIDTFGDEFLVVCPRCSKRAVVHKRRSSEPAQVVLACEHCGANQFWKQTTPGVLVSANRRRYKVGQISMGDAVDWYFHHPLWLQIACCGETLWAYNQQHLAFIEDYVQATLREKRPGDHGWSNRSLRSRLPRWIQAAKNRATVLDCIDKLKQKL